MVWSQSGSSVRSQGGFLDQELSKFSIQKEGSQQEETKFDYFEILYKYFVQHRHGSVPTEPSLDSIVAIKITPPPC